MVTFRRLGVSLCLLSACFAQHTPRRCADVAIPTSDGKTIHIRQYHGKVVMIAMMKTDCSDCHAALSYMAKLQHDLGPRGFQAIGVSIDDDRTLAKPYAERYRFPFPIGSLDPSGAIKLMDLRADAHPVVPYIMFVDWEGNVRFQYAANDPVFKDGEKNMRAVADGLLRQAIEKTGQQLAPAGKQSPPPAPAQAATPAPGKTGSTTTGTDAKTVAATATAKQ
jgi:peroxiredoxin